MWQIDYYEKENGDVPVIEFLEGLTDKLYAKALRAIDLLGEKGTTLKEPYVKPVDGPIWELRINLPATLHGYSILPQVATNSFFCTDL